MMNAIRSDSAVLTIYDTGSRATAIRFVNDVVRRLPFACRSSRPTMARTSNRDSIRTWSRSPYAIRTAAGQNEGWRVT